MDGIRTFDTLPCRCCQHDCRATDRTTGGLGMETTVERVAEFCLAASTQFKVFHRCQGPVVGGFFNQGITRAAICAINKRV